MTFNTFTEKLKKIRSSNIAGAKLLISDLEESTNMCNAFDDDFPIEYIRLKGSYPKATIKRVFSILGVEVTRVTKKSGKHKWKTIVHFKDAVASAK